MPRLPIRNVMLLLYGAVWGGILIIKSARGEPVSLEMLGGLAVGIVAIRLAFKDDKPPEDS